MLVDHREEPLNTISNNVIYLTKKNLTQDNLSFQFTQKTTTRKCRYDDSRSRTPIYLLLYSEMNR